MAVDPRVRLLWVRDLEPERAPSADVVVATAVQTAEAVARWPAAAGRKFYFVQGYETWELPAERVHASWHLPLRKFAVSRWLCDLIAAAGSCADHLPNGLDPVAFGVDRPMRERAPLQILWPHHRLRFKGSADVLEAVRRLDDAHAPVELHAFGTGSAPRGGRAARVLPPQSAAGGTACVVQQRRGFGRAEPFRGLGLARVRGTPVRLCGGRE
jgi:hypothetical protein